MTNFLKENWRYLNPFSKVKVGYLGWLGYGNLGDEAMYAAYQRLFPDLELLPFKHSKKIEILEKLGHRKIFNSVILGGGTLINRPDFLRKFQEAQLRYPLTFIFGAGVRSPEFWEKKKGIPNTFDGWRGCFQKCAYAGVRGPLSRQILKDNGFPEVEVIGDPALFLADDEIKKKRKHKKIGINIGTGTLQGDVWGNEREILAFVVRLAKTLLEKGWQIEFLPVWDRDLPYIEEALKALDGNRVNIFPDYLSIDKTLGFLEDCDVFIGEKLHSVILAMCAHTPSLMLEYRPKCLDFMKSMDLERFNMRTDQLKFDESIGLIEELYRDSDRYQDFIFQKTAYYKRIQKERSQCVSTAIKEQRLNA